MLTVACVMDSSIDRFVEVAFKLFSGLLIRRRILGTGVFCL